MKRPSNCWPCGAVAWSTITVADRGTGIDQKLRDHVFDRFAHDGDGIGLGLAISQALAEVQSGSIALTRPAGGWHAGHGHAALGALTTDDCPALIGGRQSGVPTV